MFSIALAGFEVLIVLVGIALLFWWTNKEASEASAAMPKLMTEQDYMNNMVKEADAVMKRRKLSKVGVVLPRETCLELQRNIVYHATRVGVFKQASFRQERRAFFADKNWKKYRTLIVEAEKDKETRMVTFTSHLLTELAIQHNAFIQSVRMCPAHLLQTAQERAILQAYTDQYASQETGLEPVKESIARFAEVDYQVKMAALQNSGVRRSEIDQLVERYKIEDFIFETHLVETEHLLLLKKEQMEQEQQRRDRGETNTTSEQQSTVHSTSQSASNQSVSGRSQESVQDEFDEELGDVDQSKVDKAVALVADMPCDIDSWAPTRQCQWFSEQFTMIMPVRLTKEEKLIPFSKLMQINKVIHPRLNSDYLNKRRQLYLAKDWKAYEKCVSDSLSKSLQVAESGYKAMNEILGLKPADFNKSMFAYSLDLDRRDIIEDFMRNYISPQTSQASRQQRQPLTKAEVLDAVRLLNESQQNANRKAQQAMKDQEAETGEPVPTEFAQEAMQARIQIEMCKTRDMLFVERQIGEHDIEKAIGALNLEPDEDFGKMMKEHAKFMNNM